jgi:hypothetical protein
VAPPPRCTASISGVGEDDGDGRPQWETPASRYTLIGPAHTHPGVCRAAYAPPWVEYRNRRVSRRLIVPNLTRILFESFHHRSISGQAQAHLLTIAVVNRMVMRWDSDHDSVRGYKYAPKKRLVYTDESKLLV